MTWRSVQFDWNHVRAFLVVAEEGTFSAAARDLGTTQPTIGRQIAALEAQLGLVLMQRVGNQQVLTSAGLELIEHVRSMGEAANRVSLAAAGQSEAIGGPVVVTASELIAAYLLGTAVAEIRERFPSVELEVVASNEIRDLQRREADIAVRNAPPAQPDLVARKVAHRRAGMYAAPAYLDRIGRPACLADIERAEFFGFDRSDRMIGHMASLGVRLTQANFPVVTGSHLVQWQLARQGLGICFVMEQVGDADPLMERVLPDFPALPVPIWLTSHREVRTSRRVRAVFDILAAHLS